MITMENIALIESMVLYHIGGHLDNATNAICLHNAGSEKEVFLEQAGDLDIDPTIAASLIDNYFAMPCNFSI